jgi:hypothetical protein
MKYSGSFEKMRVEHNSPINYFLQLQEEEIFLNPLISKNIRIEFQKQIHCVHCHRSIKKAFGEGFCYPCFISVPEAEDCVLRPEMCKAHEGIARDMEYAQTHCLINHYVYLAVSGGVKVGITRHTQIPTRWIDQGASSAIIFAMTPNRYLAGLIEVSLKQHISDKTNWRAMLQNNNPDTDLINLKKTLKEKLPKDLSAYILDDNSIATFNFPVLEYPAKITSVNLDSNPVVDGILSGIKGQYLMFQNGNVFNVRRHSGYQITMEF